MYIELKFEGFVGDEEPSEEDIRFQWLLYQVTCLPHPMLHTIDVLDRTLHNAHGFSLIVPEAYIPLEFVLPTTSQDFLLKQIVLSVDVVYLELHLEDGIFGDRLFAIVEHRTYAEDIFLVLLIRR